MRHGCFAQNEHEKEIAITTISLEEAQATLSDLIHKLAPGEELILTENDQPVARLVRMPPPARKRQLGTLKGTVLYMAPDFDEPLDEFKEYME